MARVRLYRKTIPTVRNKAIESIGKDSIIERLSSCQYIPSVPSPENKMDTYSEKLEFEKYWINADPSGKKATKDRIDRTDCRIIEKRSFFLITKRILF